MREDFNEGLLGGVYHFQHVRDGEVIDEWDAENLLLTAGIAYMLNAALGGASAITTWYLGLFQSNYTPVASDTAANIGTSNSFNYYEVSGYTAGSRQTWSPAAVASSANTITNSASQASFTFNATATIYGALLVSASTIGSTSGTLCSAAQFGTSKSVVSGDQLLVTYALTLSSS